MKRDLVKINKSSFISYEADLNLIIRKLFVENKPYSDELKRLLIINTSDCLDTTNAKYREIINSKSVADLKKEGYIKTTPKMSQGEHEEVKSYIIITMDDFFPNATNPKFRDCVINFDVICYNEYWDLTDYRIRPMRIMGLIDGILNEEKLTGIGTLHFRGATMFHLGHEFTGYTLSYQAVHGEDDLEVMGTAEIERKND